MTTPEPEEGIDLPVDKDAFDALVAEDEAQWRAFRDSDLGKWFIAGFKEQEGE